MPLTNAEKQKRARDKRNATLVRYEAALQFYADQDSYDCGRGDVVITDYPVMADHGDIARQALATTPG